ncbi:phosphodiesterase [Labrenzia sp. OB1]|uniref:phosphodiesterase n=1 Tax=Labrenzia sp. OB1 TaxID=1561204 RepID=UPI0007B20DC7|nr:phosphodiesterase [Labrenzia sp. OB1]KZM48664.1 3',5'-cyclic-nucleotide phosphodiesterase [Labrenzia sp. OB1]
MKLIQLTDIHLTTPGQTIADRDPNENFKKALNHALSSHPDADRIVITGDLSDWGEKSDYERLKAILSNVRIPVSLCIGNHDERDVFLSVFPEQADENGFVQAVFELPVGTGITLDTWGPDSHAGFYCEKRLGWLCDQLDKTAGPAFLFMHHNPVPIGIDPMDKIMLLDADAFAGVIAKYKHKIRHIFHGHCHLPLCGSLHGVPFSAPRGTNHAGWADFGNERNLSGSDLPEAYAVILTDDHSVMVHMIEYGYAGEVRREGSPDYADWDRLTMVR